MKKTFFALTFVTLLALTGCQSVPDQSQPAEQAATPDKAPDIVEQAIAGKDTDGFVRLAGEPSRGDSAYYVTGEVCEQFTLEYVSSLLGRPVFKAETSMPGRSTDCKYLLGPSVGKNMVPNVSLNLQFLSVADQVKGHEVLGRTVGPDPSIPMENYVVKQENGLINEIYLVLGPEKYLNINRSSGKSLSEEDLLGFARKLGEKMKDFK